MSESSPPKKDPPAKKQKTTTAEDGATQTSGKIDALTGTLQSTLVALQNTLTNAHASMVGNLQQSMQMMMMMNGMMEEFLRNCINISSNVVGSNSHPGSISVHITINNSSRLPLHQAQLGVMLTHASSKRLASGVVHVEHGCDAFPKIQGPIPLSVTESEEASYKWTPVSSVTPVVSPASTQKIHYRIEPPAFDQYNCLFVLAFRSPGTEKQLDCEHVLGIYLLHQCTLAFSATPKSTSTSNSEEKSPSESKNTKEKVTSAIVECKLVRDLFHVPPSAGIVVGSTFTITNTAKDTIELTVTKILEKGARLSLAGQHLNPPSTQSTQQLGDVMPFSVRSILNELTQLSSTTV